MTTEEAEGQLWGTWRQLVLGGAVLRHGTADWRTVAAEMRRRFPHPFTPEECAAKYADSRKRFLDFSAWFETLRKQRAEELKTVLAKSEGSIGCLQSKLENLMRSAKVHKEEKSRLCESFERTDISNKESLDNDRSSAGSFIDEAGCGFSSTSSIKTENESPDGYTASMPGSVRRKRGTRERRFQCQEKYLEGILDAIAGHRQVSLFRHRLDSQKRSRYRKMIRRHVDFKTVRMGIRDETISSDKEVFRELLLICNNALVFFSKRSPEHEAALVLRKLVAEKL